MDSAQRSTKKSIDGLAGTANDNLFKVMEGGAIVVVPQPKERTQLAPDTHRRMGHFGVQRVLDQLQKNYY